ncbi:MULTISPECIES: restriction endonuclease subunit S [Aeromonas]|uniref:restriction endonuclease subunit S n=1 Tax=Aeromonas TaxID=642 RepID=UPI0038D1DDEB
MKAGWEKKRLSELCTVFADGDWIESKDQAPEGIRLIQTGNVGEGVFKDRGDKARFISEATFEKLRCTEIFEGDCLISRLPDPVGRSCILPNVMERMITAVDCTIIRFDTAKICPEFFNYYSQSSEYLNAVDAETTGTTRKRISRSKLAQTLIPVPSFPEQQRIVGILDEAFEAISAARTNAEQNRQNARALFESYLQSVFSQRGNGWINKPLSELCDIKHGFAFKSEYFTNEGDYTLLTPGNFFETGGYRDRGDKQKFYSGDIPQGFLLEAGDLLVAMTEQAAGLLGSPIIVPSQGKFLHNQRLGLVSGKPGIPWLNEFFFHVFNTQAVRQAIHESASGAKVRHTSPTKIGAVTVAFPTSIEEQKAIVATLDTLTIETQRLESLYQRKIAVLDELKQSLLHQAFSGNL